MKIRDYFENILEGCLAFLLYGFVEAFYMRPTIFGNNKIVETVVLALVTILVFAVIDWFYRHQLKSGNDWFFNSKPHFKARNLAIAFAGFFLIWVAQFAFARLLGGTSNNQAELNKILAQTNTFRIIVALIGPIFEELIFRGIFFNTFFTKENSRNKWLGIICSGLLFGLAHEPRLSKFLIIYWVMGAILAWVYLQTRDLRYSMTVHILNNVLSLL